MKKILKNIFGIALLVCCAVIALALPVKSEEMLTLVVRPELLGRSERRRQAPVPSRNIFAWPDKRPKQDLSKQRQAEETALEAMRNLKADAILWDRTTPLAIISGKLVGVGDEFSGIRVLDMRKDSVTLKKQNIEHILRFEAVEINLRPGSAHVPTKKNGSRAP